jgi:hypothetical protein
VTTLNLVIVFLFDKERFIPSLLVISRTPLSLPHRTIAPPKRRCERVGSLVSTLSDRDGGEESGGGETSRPRPCFIDGVNSMYSHGQKAGLRASQE